MPTIQERWFWIARDGVETPTNATSLLNLAHTSERLCASVRLPHQTIWQVNFMESSAADHVCVYEERTHTRTDLLTICNVTLVPIATLQWWWVARRAVAVVTGSHVPLLSALHHSPHYPTILAEIHRYIGMAFPTQHALLLRQPIVPDARIYLAN